MGIDNKITNSGGYKGFSVMGNCGRGIPPQQTCAATLFLYKQTFLVAQREQMTWPHDKLKQVL